MFSLSIFFLCAKAQQKNTTLHIFYVPGFVEIYQKNDDKVFKIDKKFRLASLENYLFYNPIAENTAPLPLPEEMVYNFKYNLQTSKPGLYYLLSNTHYKYAGTEYEYPAHWLWLGEGSQQIDLYSVVINEADLKNENSYYSKNHYRFYFEGLYEKQNKFLQQYTSAMASIEAKFQTMAQQKYTNYYDSSDEYKKKMQIELAGLYAAKKDTFFKSIDSVSIELNKLYKSYFIKVDADFDKVIKPELLTFANALKMYYCTYFISTFNDVQTIYTTEMVKIATAILKEMDALPLQLSSENYRNTYFSYVNAMMWAGKTDTIRPSTSNQVYFESIAPIISHEFGNRPVLQEYLFAATVYFMINYMSYEAATIARSGYGHFIKQYPASVYNTLLERAISKKEEKLKMKDEDISKVNSDTTELTPAPVADTIPEDEVVLEAPAFIPPKIPNDINDNEVKFWNLNLYTAYNKVVKLRNLKGKRIAVKALIYLPESRDLAYFQYLEKKFPALVFVYIFETVPNPAALKLFKSFNLKGQCLFMKTILKDDKNTGLWNDEIYYPYWQFINTKGRIKHIYQLDNVEKLISQWLKNKPLYD